MKKKLKVIIIILIMSIISIWILRRIPFENDIKQTITAKIYKDGVVVQDTSVIINGARSNYLFSDIQHYNGQFIVEYYERSGRKGMKASITWTKEYENQRVLYYQNGTFPTLEIYFQLLINGEMKEFAVGMNDGTIIATSDEMYHNYVENINILK